MRRRETHIRHTDRHSKLSHEAQPGQGKSGSPEERRSEGNRLSITRLPEDVRRDDWSPTDIGSGSTLLQPRDVLTLEELNAFADEVAEFVEDSRFAAIEERLMADIDRLDRADRQLSSGRQMRANPVSA